MRIFAVIVLFCVSRTGNAQQPALSPTQIARVENLFRGYATTDAPGCALGVSLRDTVVLERAWGSADLEHAVPITPQTIFEAGSVSKQFTTAAVLRLAQQGKLSLDDDVRKYVPELPVYDAPITLRHLIHHTSGLRDWGVVMAIAGWPRGTRTYTHAHVLDIIARQRATNFPVGTEYLYSNSNYNLLAMIAERVSGKSLAEFTRAELFEPLGMTRTGWRDNYTRIVRGRAQAYAGEGKEWRLQMPFENVYGNSSLLTTVGDMLKWSGNSAHGRVGGREFVSMQERRGRLKNGREIRYAGGVIVGEFNDTREIYHDGATAGYRAFLARYPDAGYAVALLCNAGNADPSGLGRQVAEVLIPRVASAVAAPPDTIGVAVPAERLSQLAGHYRQTRSNAPLQIIMSKGRLRIGDGPTLVAISERHFTSLDGRSHFVFEQGVRKEKGRIRSWAELGDTIEYVPADAPLATAKLGDYEGRFLSEEADATLSVEIAAGKLILVLPPGSGTPLTSAYADGFTALGTFVRFTRGRDGTVDGFSVTSGRARNIRFDKVHRLTTR